MKEIDETLLRAVIQERPLESHKGDYGRLLLIGGTYPYGGAIILAALAAVHSGAGLVTVATDVENIPALHAHLPEAMACDIKDKSLLWQQLNTADVVLIGPGLADNEPNTACLKAVLDKVRKEQILIIDGGALSLLSKEALPFPKAQTVFTPHQREWERLSGLMIDQQTDEANQESVNYLSQGSIVVQKKHGTCIYQSGNAEVRQILAGGPHQATGGMGDTLAGMIAGFAGQFQQASLLDRVSAATYLHSAIADKLHQEAYVVLPTDISRQIPHWMKTMSEERE